MNDDSIEVHGAHVYDATGAISEPIYLSATYRHPGYKQSTGFDYGRVANPTRKELEDVLAKLERGQRAWAVSSGMAAINMVLHLLNPGDHILLSEDLYGGTVRLVNDIYKKYGLTYDYVNTADLEATAAKIRQETKMIFIETPSNPMMLVSDIRAIAELAHKNGALLTVDNTFLSPHFQKPLTLGADIVVHSATKYLCGHNDIIAGVIAIADAASDYGQDLELYIKSEGPNLTPIDSWLLLRSIKTLGIRVERQAQSAMKVAEWLQTQPTVTDVYYVGLPDHPGHALHESQATGFGSMISFKTESPEHAVRVLGPLSDDERQSLLDGVQLEDGPAAFGSIEDGGGEGANRWYRVTISEGRNREVRRMFEAVGHAVSRLIRIRYGAMVLPRGLKRGAWMELDEHDIRALMQAAGMPSQPRPQAAPGRSRSAADRGGARPALRSRPPQRSASTSQPDPMKTSVGYIGADSLARQRQDQRQAQKRAGRRSAR